MNITETDLKIYRDAIKENVCKVCEDLGYHDLCGVREGECIIESHLPKVLEAVLSTPASDKIEDYLPTLREMVCGKCLHQDGQGKCEMRDHAYCNLDSLFILVVETIEEVSGRTVMKG